jgi:hypothetical protein
MRYRELIPRYDVSWAGIARIGSWCVLFLWLAGALLPPLQEKVPFEKALAGTAVTPMATIVGDSRGFRADIRPDPQKLNIAWILDSSGVLAPPGKIIRQEYADQLHFLPDLVAQKLQKRPGMKDLNVYLYCQLGAHPLNLLLYALQAIRDKPDLIVLPLNPVWAFSHYQVFNTQETLAIAPRLLSPHPALWPLIPLLASPSQNMHALLGARFPVLRDASPAKLQLKQMLWDEEATAGGAADFDILTTSVNFWVFNQLIRKQPGHKNDDGEKLLIQDIYSALLRDNSPAHADSLSVYAFEETLRLLQQSGIPALIYAPPMQNSFNADPIVQAQMATRKEYLAAKTKDFPDIRILPDVPEKVRNSVGFIPGDGFHESRAGTMPDYLADQIMQILHAPPAKTH